MRLFDPLCLPRVRIRQEALCVLGPLIRNARHVLLHLLLLHLIDARVAVARLQTHVVPTQLVVQVATHRIKGVKVFHVLT